MHLLFETLYTMYPYLWSFAEYCLFVPLWVMEQFVPSFLEVPDQAVTAGTILSLALYAALYSGVAVLGMVFVLHIISVSLSWLGWLGKSERTNKRKLITSSWFPRRTQLFALCAWVFYTVLLFHLFYPQPVYVPSVAREVAEKLLIPQIFFFLLGIGFVFYLALRGGWALLWQLVPKLAERRSWRTLFLLTSVTAVLLPVSVVTIVLIEIFIDPINQHDSPNNWGAYSVVHAAIKNTCLIDPAKENCPQTLEEISFIEPQQYQQMRTAAQQVIYQYDPASNQYTLIVRYSPVRVAVFDQRLIAEFGVDAHDYQVSVLGQDRVVDAPEFLRESGLDVFPEWEY